MGEREKEKVLNANFSITTYQKQSVLPAASPLVSAIRSVRAGRSAFVFAGSFGGDDDLNRGCRCRVDDVPDNAVHDLTDFLVHDICSRSCRGGITGVANANA